MKKEVISTAEATFDEDEWAPEAVFLLAPLDPQKKHWPEETQSDEIDVGKSDIRRDARLRRDF